MNPDQTDTKLVGDAVTSVRESLEKHEKLPDADLFAEYK